MHFYIPDFLAEKRNKDGSISIPTALVPYMDGVDLLKG